MINDVGLLAPCDFKNILLAPAQSLQIIEIPSLIVLSTNYTFQYLRSVLNQHW